MLKNTPWLLIVTVVAIGLVVAACGTPAPPPPAPTTPPPPPPPAPTTPPPPTPTTPPPPPEPTATPSPPEAEPTATPVPVEPSPTPTPSPTRAPAPTATPVSAPEIKYEAPILTWPEDGTIWGERYYAVLRWEPVGELAEDEYYDVQVSWDNGTRFWGEYQQDTEWAFPEWLRGEPEDDTFYWNVTVRAQIGEARQGPSDPALSPPSDTWFFQLQVPPP